VNLSTAQQSQARARAISLYGGKKLVGWSLVVISAGLAGFWQLPMHQSAYPWAAALISFVAALVPVVCIQWWVRQHPADAPARPKNRLVSWSGQAVVGVLIAMFIKSFIASPYKIPVGVEAGVTKGSHWIASHLDTGFASGDLIIFQHESGRYWIARVVKQEGKGLQLKRGGSPDEFFMPWDKIVGKMLFANFSPDLTAENAVDKRDAGPQLVFVISGVVRPGPVSWTEGMTILDAIASCKGFTTFAHPSKVKVIRGTEVHPLNLHDPQLRFELRRGDQIIIPE